MRVLDSRRLTGPGLLLDRPGAVLDLEVDPARREAAAAAWREAVERLLAGVGWHRETVRVRPYGGGLSLGFTAPSDTLYAATELNDAAWAAAERSLAGGSLALGGALDRLRGVIAAERNPALLAMREAAAAHDVTFLHGEEQVSVGSGRGVRVWHERALPRPEAVDWSAVHDIPSCLVTGSNGKTTVVRLLAAMVTETGRTAGITSTDAVRAGERMVDQGDYSGPNGARLLLRQPDLDVAVLETARGGLLRRGLTVSRAEAAVVTNVADDHLGEFGVETLEALAETKLLVARAIGPGGRLVVNAEDPVLAPAAERVPAPHAWFALDPGERRLRGGPAATVEEGALVLRQGDRHEVVATVSELPLAFGGAARHNVANLLAALLASPCLGVPLEAARATLRRFGLSPADNPGRTNLIELSGIRILVDYAHNPHGMRALAETTAAIPAARRLVLVGQAGDRSDAALRDLAGATLALRADRILVKEMDRYLRGRAPGEVPGLLISEFRRLGVPPDRVSAGGPELAAVRAALAWARPGDLLVLALHQDREAVMALLAQLRTRGWTPGEPVG